MKLDGFGGEPGIVPLLWWHSRCGTKGQHRCACPGKGCPWERGVHGKKCPRKWCPWEGMCTGKVMTLRKDVHGKGWPWEGMLLGMDAPGTLLSQGGHAPPITHHALFQGRCHTSGVHRHAENPAAPVLQGQALGEHVQSSLGGQIPLLSTVVWQCQGQWRGNPAGGDPKFLPILQVAVPCCSDSRCPASPPKPRQPRWSPGCWRC